MAKALQILDPPPEKWPRKSVKIFLSVTSLVGSTTQTQDTQVGSAQGISRKPFFERSLKLINQKKTIADAQQMVSGEFGKGVSPDAIC